MDSPTRRLRQQRATLVATQGDPDLPIGGTLYARLVRLRAELQQSLRHGESGLVATHGRSAPPSFGGGNPAASARSTGAIHADMREVHAEIRTIQDEIDRIDVLISAAEGKPTR